MSIRSKIEFAWFFVMSLLWIYIAVRIGGRAVIRSIHEYKNKFVNKGAYNGHKK